MDQKAKKTQEIEKIIFNTVQWQESITFLDLSNRAILKFDENIKLPPNLVELNLSKNKFQEVPLCVLRLENINTLDISYNDIVLFDKEPNFIKNLECLNLSNNKLEELPSWLWGGKTKEILQLDLSNNVKICNIFSSQSLEDLLQYTIVVNRIDLHCCKISKDIKIMTAFKHAKEIILGSKEYNSYHTINHIENIPCSGLEDCCDIQLLDLCNTYIYNVEHNIDIYQNLIEINLSDNNINGLPNEFCNLKNLEICILSVNKILYLPEDMHKLKKLTQLYLDNNELCTLPENLHLIKGLKTLDLYNNHLYEGFHDVSNLEQYDFAQNYCDEPQDEEYFFKKENLRQNAHRLDGRLPEHIEYDKYEEDDESHFLEEDTNDMQSELQTEYDRCSSPEDWDSDNYWIPSALDINTYSTPLHKKHTNNILATGQWLDFIKRKMKEGNFCPIDMHLTISITDKVKYEKICNPIAQYESDGQFDDYSDDDT